MIVLVGFMGAGKTTVGRLVAEQLGLPFVDVDALIERRGNVAIPDIFAERGEAGFRAIEHDTIVELLRGPEAVVAVGGGAVSHAGTRAALADTRVIYLRVTLDEALGRVAGDAHRPMLRTPDIRQLHERRLPLYGEVATFSLDTDGRAPEAVALDAIRLVTVPRALPAGAQQALVAPAGGSYQVTTGAGVVGHLDQLLPPLPHAEQAFVISRPVPDGVTGAVVAALEGRGLRVETLPVPDGELAKSLPVAEHLYDELARHAAHPGDLVVGVGGSATCDLAGFVASTYNRGMPVAHVPTTLLAQVDTAIGGKTALNLSRGRNLVGTIHQPVAVVCDTDLAVAGRGSDSWRSGLAEVVKAALIADAGLLERLELQAPAILAGDVTALTAVAARAVAIKAGIVTADERERGQRLSLNYGHTFAHAIEHVWDLEEDRHGEAVSLGMMAAAFLARRLGRIDDAAVEAHERVLRAFGLPVRAPLEADALERAWLRDKKYRQGVRFVLLGRIGSAEGGIAAPREAVLAALADLCR